MSANEPTEQSSMSEQQKDAVARELSTYVGKMRSIAQMRVQSALGVKKAQAVDVEAQVAILSNTALKKGVEAARNAGGNLDAMNAVLGKYARLAGDRAIKAWEAERDE